MVGPYSPHGDAGGTLHCPSPTHIHRVDPSSVYRQLRRSLSRSPSKTPAFRLVTSKSTSASPLSPLSPSRESMPSRSLSANVLSPTRVSTPSPLAASHLSSARKTRQQTRKLSPMREPLRSNISQRSPRKRMLRESSDHGNTTPRASPESSDDQENKADASTSPVGEPMADVIFKPNASPVQASPFAPPRATAKFEKGNRSWGAKSSPLKRSDGIMNLDQGHIGSPSAKRRSLHGATFGSDFNIFDHEAASDGQPDTRMHDSGSDLDLSAHREHLSPMPKRTSSLRRTTLQQRHDKPLFTRSKANPDLSLAFATPGQTTAKTRFRMSLDNVLPPMARDSPFSSQGCLPSASAHPIFQPSAKQTSSSNTIHPQRHPLSRTISQSTSTSSMAEDSPTHVPVRQPEQRRCLIDFSKSLPLGANRPGSRDGESTSQGSSAASFATPENYKLVKPLPAAFMSTGLISKRHKYMEESQPIFGASTSTMPDTPCKRHSLAEIPSPKASAQEPFVKTHQVRHSFGTPSTPFNPQAARNTPGNLGQGVGVFGSSFGDGGLHRRGSFLSIEGEDQMQSPSGKGDSQSSADFEIPPTPTKQVTASSNAQHTLFGRSMRAKEVVSPGFGAPASAKATPSQRDKYSSPPGERFHHLSPRTPRENIMPPDPSGLSISVHGDDLARNAANIFSSASMFPPATPTAPKDHSLFGKSKSSITPSHTPAVVAVDPVLKARFDKVELIGTGEFSQVYRVSRKQELKTSRSYFSLASVRSSPRTPLPDQVWAVKKSRQPYLGPKDRQRKLQEVNTLKALGHSDHIVRLLESWEEKNHLYIQTEFCEEGSLDVFLKEVGRNARLDDFRIWKIMLEMSLGLKHIHDSGFIHLDLKPANILITFEGVVKIADFGMATRWPAQPGIEGEGDREYIGPEILRGQFDKPGDVFALGLIMLEIAGNVMLPDNGASWQRLRTGDMSDVPSLTSSSEASTVPRDSSGKPLSQEDAVDDFYMSDSGGEDLGSPNFLRCRRERSRKNKLCQIQRSGELANPPAFMVDPNNPEALDNIVRWMISPDAADRPVVDQILATTGVQWAETRRRAGGTVFEGNWGPADEVLVDDAEMIDV